MGKREMGYIEGATFMERRSEREKRKRKGTTLMESCGWV